MIFEFVDERYPWPWTVLLLCPKIGYQTNQSEDFIDR